LKKEVVFAAVCAGFSGGTADKSPLLPELIRADHYMITHDAHIALVGATAGGPGIITIAGTGSIAYGRNAEAVTARAGGWGYAFGDEGSAFDIVRHTIRALMQQEEGWGPASSVRAPMLAATDTTCADELLHLCYTDRFPREKVAALAPIVDEAARAGDPVAVEILNGAAQSLATITAAVRRQLFRDEESVAVHNAGGAFESAHLLARFRMLVELDGVTSVSAPQRSAAHGALIEAYRSSGILPA
jgi:N-acetylglucosamine kinase-like BadF-type ATPase